VIASQSQEISGSDQKTIISFLGSVLFFLVGGAAIALGIYLLIRSGKNKRLQIAEYEQLVQREIAERQRIQGAWKKAIERWNQMYYCGRDDCVSIPREQAYASISKMKEYLYK
jgi:hypothetical protein